MEAKPSLVCWQRETVEQVWAVWRQDRCDLKEHASRLPSAPESSDLALN